MPLSAEQAISNEQARLLARCYELILSWSTPETSNPPAEQSSGKLPTGKESTADTLSVAMAHGKANACSKASVTAS